MCECARGRIQIRGCGGGATRNILYDKPRSGAAVYRVFMFRNGAATVNADGR